MNKFIFIVLIISIIFLSGNLCAIAVGVVSKEPIVPTSWLYSFISVLSTIVVGFAIYIFRNLIKSINENTKVNKVEHGAIDSKLDKMVGNINKNEKDRIKKDNSIELRLTVVEKDIHTIIEKISK